MATAQLISARDYRSFRAAVARTLPDTCSIRYSADTSDGAGGFTQTWLDRATLVPCRLEAMATPAQEGTQGGRATDITAWVLTIPSLTPVTDKDRIIVTTPGGTMTFEVTGVAPNDTWDFDQRVFLTRTNV